MSRTLNRKLVIVAAAAALVSLVACANGGDDTDTDLQAAQEECTDFNFDYASYGNADSDQNQAVAWWADQVEERTERTGGAITVTAHYSASLVSAGDALAALKDGRAGLAHVGSMYATSDLPLLTVAELPFQTSNAEAQMRAVSRLFAENEEFASQFNDSGITYLFPLPLGANVMGTHEPLESVDDLSGLNFRAGGLTSDALQAVGANPVALDATEVYEAYQRGVIDGYASLALASVETFGLSEATNYLTEPGIGVYSSSVIAMSQDLFDNLCGEQQEILLEVSDEAITTGLERMEEFSITACDALLESGAEVSVWEDDQVEAWSSQLDIEESWVEERSDRYDAQSVLEDYQRFVSEAEDNSDFVPPIHVCADRSN